MRQVEHGLVPDIAGQNLANPTALIRSTAMLLRHLGAIEPAVLLTECLHSALSDRTSRTRDLGGRLGTQEFAAHLANLIRKEKR